MLFNVNKSVLMCSIMHMENRNRLVEYEFGVKQADRC